jgi:hypothetical protein
MGDAKTEREGEGEGEGEIINTVTFGDQERDK